MSVWCLNIEFRGHSHQPPLPLNAAETVMCTWTTMMPVRKMIKCEFDSLKLPRHSLVYTFPLSLFFTFPFILQSLNTVRSKFLLFPGCDMKCTAKFFLPMCKPFSNLFPTICKPFSNHLRFFPTIFQPHNEGATNLQTTSLHIPHITPSALPIISILML